MARHAKIKAVCDGPRQGRAAVVVIITPPVAVTPPSRCRRPSRSRRLRDAAARRGHAAFAMPPPVAVTPPS
ncbi:hypothetical protein ABZS96_27660, partial [Streptomyces avermitilis]|uniref:hypothetical protein n=1 Tax=Streptomyces avermitilis TaxID=33903 RepID=UPI0033BAC8BB